MHGKQTSRANSRGVLLAACMLLLRHFRPPVRHVRVVCCVLLFALRSALCDAVRAGCLLFAVCCVLSAACC
eukprot:8378320-Lingulodinium_polyedra.AAC.1